MAGDAVETTPAPEAASDPTGGAAAARGGAQPAAPGPVSMDQGQPALPAVNPAVNRPTYPVQYGSIAQTGPTPTPEETLKGDSFGSKVYHGVLNALAGSQDVVQTGIDANGKPIFSTTQMGPGQQWKKIISGALTGLAAGSQVQGRGSAMRAFGAGEQASVADVQRQQAAQRTQAQQTFENQQKAALNSANVSMLTTQVAKATYDLGRAKVQASVEDTDRMTKFMSMINEGGEGTRYLNHFPTIQDAQAAFRADPSLHDAHAQGQLVAVPHVGADGQVDGVDAAYVTKDWMDRKIDKDFTFTTQQYKDGKVQDISFTVPKGSKTNGEIMQLQMGQAKDSMDEHRKNITTQSEVELRGAQVGEAKGRTAEAYASAGKQRAETAALGAEGTEGMSHDALVDAFGRGQLSATQMSRVIAKNPGMLREIVQKYPDFDSGKIDAYIKAEKDFTDGKTADQMTAGGTALTHLHDLMQMNTNASHIPLTADYNAYHNLLDTLAGELTRFYGTESVEARKHIIDTLGAQAPNNRQAAITAQISAMSRRFDQIDQRWKNAAPSAAYEAKKPQLLDDDAIAARIALDPRYAARPEAKAWLQQHTEAQPGQQPGQPATQQINLPNAPPRLDNGVDVSKVPQGSTIYRDPVSRRPVGYYDSQKVWHGL